MNNMDIPEEIENETRLKQQKEKINLMDNLSKQNFIIFPQIP